MAQTVKNPPAMQETWVRFLGQEDPLEKGMQYSCLENPMNRRVWWATVHGVTLGCSESREMYSLKCTHSKVYMKNQ